MYLPASFVTAVANVATPGDSLLPQASAGQPNQQDQRRLPEEGLSFLTVSAEWHGDDAPTPYAKRIAAIGGFGGALGGLDVDLGGLWSLRSICSEKMTNSSSSSKHAKARF
jgi:hypothetical protein